MHTTIAALSTFPGTSAVGIIRISGPDVFNAVEKVFSFSSGEKSISNAKPRFAYHGTISDEKSVIDDVLLILFRAPFSYTGEDMAEIYCHGNPLILNKVLDMLFENKTVPAEPGEFTKRAFINGKIDLSQAEAVAGIISAENEAAVRINAAQLSGREKESIRSLSKKIKKILASLEIEIDFAYEDIQKTSYDSLIRSISECISSINTLIKGADEGIMLKNGIKTVLTGRPNSGKSSILNAVLKKDRAIVTSTPGTTRDTIESPLTIDGLPFIFIDTAGIRDSMDIIETEGINRAKKALESADVIINVIDGSTGLSDKDFDPAAASPDKRIIFAVNKSDLDLKTSVEEVKRKVHENASVILINTTEKNGVSGLTKELKNIIMNKEFIPVEEITVSSRRHKQALLKANKSLENALNACREKMSFEFPAADIKEAVKHIQSILGGVSSDDILEEIFSNFCIGK
ncbi:MAG: tRNA uridine-5-carboxymethylaminomethyl(34) synthesis GTPase MnmE [bacterium]